METTRISELNRAIDEILGHKVSEAMRADGFELILMHKMACLRAFSENRQDENADILRTMYNELIRTGYYPLEATIMIDGVAVTVPIGAVAYKYADPIDAARWIDDVLEAETIAHIDPSLIVWAMEGRA